MFDIPVMSGGYHLDSAATWLSFNVTLQSIGVTMSSSFDFIWTEGFNPLSIGFSCTFASGHLVEDIKNSHMLYGLVKTDMYDGMVARSAEAPIIITITQHNVDSAFGGAIYQQTTAGGTL